MAEQAPGYTTEALVDVMHQQIAGIAAEIPDGIPNRVAIVSPVFDHPNASYLVEALSQGQRPDSRVQVEAWLPYSKDGFEVVAHPDRVRGALLNTHLGRQVGGLALRDTIGHLNKQQIPYVILSSPAAREFDRIVAETADPVLELDGMAANSQRTPATPEAMVLTANHILFEEYGIESVAELTDEQILVLGNGGVCGPLVKEVLRRERNGRGIAEGNHYPNRGDLPAGSERLATDASVAVGFSATLAPGNLTGLTENTLLVDFGYAIDPMTGKPSGNASRELAALNGKGGRIILAFRRAGGPVTIAKVLTRGTEVNAGMPVDPLQISSEPLKIPVAA